MCWLTIGAWFSFPNAEDLSISYGPRDMGVVNSVVKLLQEYDGRYFTNLLHALNPLAFGAIEGYWLMPLLGIVLLAGAGAFFIATVANGTWQNGDALLVSLLFITCHMAISPSLPHDLYWMISSFVYMWPWTFTLLWIGALVRYQRSQQLVWFIVAAFGLICSLGMNEMFLVLNGVLLLIMAVYGWSGGVERWRRLLPLMVIGLSSILFFITCPGIHNRMAEQHLERNMSYLLGIPYASASDLIFFVGQWLTTNTILIPLAVVSMLLISVPRGFGLLKSISPWRAFGIAFAGLAVLWLMTWAYYVAMGTFTGIPERVFASVLYGFQIWIIAVFAYVSDRIGMTERIGTHPRLSRVFIALLGIVALSSIVLSENNINNIRREYTDGTYQRYKTKMRERYRILALAKDGSEWTEAVFEPLSSPPTTNFYPPEILPNRSMQSWNRAYERYFGIDEARLKNDTLTKLTMNAAAWSGTP